MRFSGAVILFLLLGLCVSCSSVRSISKEDIAYLYRLNDEAYSVDYFVVQENDSTYDLHYQFPNDLFSPVQDLLTQKKLLQFTSGIVVYHHYQSRDIIDSLFVPYEYILVDDLEEDCYRAKMRFRMKDHLSDQVVRFFLNDQNSAAAFETVFLLKDKLLCAPSSLCAYSAEGNYQLLAKLYQGDAISIPSVDPLSDTLSVCFTAAAWPIALPPYVVAKDSASFAYDSCFTLMADSLSGFVLSNLTKGRYEFRLREQVKGYTVYGSGFPKYTSPEDLLSPLRYITSHSEYQALITADNPKIALDQFWISMSGSSEEAKKRIKDYYTKVSRANVLFSSYKEGWKTDRGMIFIIFGVPKNVYRFLDKEIWLYSDPFDMNMLQFVFNKQYTFEGAVDYVLDRSSYYKPYWYIQVNKWRK